MKALFIVAQEGYQDHEYGAPKKILENAGVEVVTASKKAGLCQGNFGATTEATVALANVNVTDYDAIVFIGGPGAVAYQQDSEAHAIAKATVNEGKILGAICIAPTTLAYAGVLQGKKATVWNEDGKQQDVLTSNGAEYSGENVTVDGKLVTANGPPAAEEFGKKLLELLQS